MKARLFSAWLFAAAPALAAAAPPPLCFARAPLGNVVRVISARYGATVTLAAGAAAPISGDFSGLGLRAALAAAARQAGLVVVANGPDSSGAFRIERPPPPPPRAALAAEAARRAALLDERRRLLKAGTGPPAP
jgi:hypothetical protein